MRALLFAIILFVLASAPLSGGDFPVFVYDMNSAAQLCNENGLDYLSSMAGCGIGSLGGTPNGCDFPTQAENSVYYIYAC